MTPWREFQCSVIATLKDSLNLKVQAIDQRKKEVAELEGEATTVRMEIDLRQLMLKSDNEDALLTLLVEEAETALMASQTLVDPKGQVEANLKHIVILGKYMKERTQQANETGKSSDYLQADHRVKETGG